MSLRFDSQQEAAPRKRFVSRSQLRLLSLMVGLVLIFYMMQLARSPDTTRKLELLFGSQAADRQPASELKDGWTAVEVDKDGLMEQIDLELLTNVEDNAPFSNEEGETTAWFHLLEIARGTDQATLEAVSLGDVVYAQLVGQPQYYRGRVVSVRGIVRRIETIQPAANDLGIDQLYRVILQPNRDGRLPFTLYCVELPPGWSINSPKNATINFTGFFFKNQVYRKQAGVDLTPVLISGSFRPLVQQTAPQAPEPLLPSWLLVALAAVVACAVVALVWVSGRESPRQAIPSEDVQAVAATLHDLDSEGN